MVQSYFFQTTSDLIHESDLLNTVGIGLNNSNPLYHLDVKGTTHTSNLLVDATIETTTLNTSNLTATGLIQSSNIINTGQLDSATAVVDYVYGSNITSSNITATCSLNINGNIIYDGYNMYDPYPNEPITADWWFAENPGVIHMSWIRDEANIFQDVMGVFGTLVDAADFLNEMYQWYQIWSGNNTKVDWDEIGNRPIASKDDNIGFDGNIYVGTDYKLKVCSSSKFLTNPITGILDFNFIEDELPVAPSGDTILDFETRELT
jgi:hypothetical protein